MTRCDKSFLRLGKAAAVALPLAALAPIAGLAAEARHVALDYEIYVGGFHTFSVAYDVQLSPAAYDMTVALDGKGILDWWFAWRMKAFSEGRLTRRGVVPVRAGADSSWNGKQRQTRLHYPPDGLPKVLIDPLPEDDGDREEVRPELRKGARDLAGALFAMMSRIGDSGRCDAREAVFDGRRRYDLVLTHLGEDKVAPNSYSSYAGPALRCRLELKRIAGYRRNPERSSRWRQGEPATVWIARVYEDAPPVPVRLELDTLMGGLVAHLVRSRTGEGRAGTMPARQAAP